MEPVGSSRKLEDYFDVMQSKSLWSVIGYWFRASIF